MAGEADSARKDPLIGRVIDGRYTVLHLIGKGGMGAVYRAHQASLDRSVALKVLLGAPDRSREVEFQRRFFLEASTVAKLKHPNTITVFDYGSEEIGDVRIYFIAMELLEGRTLTQALKAGPMPLPQMLSITVQSCRSLREAHRAGVVHRDLKPGNIMLIPHDDDAEGEAEMVKVLDFGLAKTFEADEQELTQAGTFLGSPRYVSPEQVEGRHTDPRSDIYSLACVMYKMLVGRVPFDGNAPVEVMLKHLNEAPPPLPPDVPPLLQKLVMACLEKDPKNRPSSMEEVISRLKLVRASVGGQVGFMSVSDDRAAGGPTPTPWPARAPSRPTTRPEAAATPGLGGVDRRALDPGVVPFDETRPTRNVLRLGPPPRSRGSTFLRGVVAGTLVALALLLAFELGLDEWIEQNLAPAASQTQPESRKLRPHLVRLRITSEPPAELFELLGAEELRRGTTPLDLDWPVAPGVKARTFVLKKEGYALQPLAVPVPDDDGQDPQLVELKVELTRER